MRLFRYAPIFWQLLKADFIIFKTTFLDKLFNAFLWASTTIAVTSYLLPVFGFTPEYGNFVAAGVVISCSSYEIFPQVGIFLADMEGIRHVDYYLTLPLPSWLYLIKVTLIYTIDSLLMALMALGTAKFFLMQSFATASSVSFLKLVLMLLLTNIFFGFFGLWLISITKGMHTIENTFSRFIYIMWFLGGHQFTWQILWNFSPTLAYFSLINPYIYAFEGIRFALLGSKGLLSFWLSVSGLCFFIIFFGWLGITRLKKRLDFV